MITDYKPIEIPFDKSTSEMDKREVKLHWDWYFAIMPCRIKHLAECVRSTPGYENWEADYSPESLVQLGNWMRKQVEKRQKTKEEIEKEIANLPDWVPLDTLGEWTLTYRAFSIAIDIGMYVSQVFYKHIPGLKWKLYYRAKNYINYGLPVLEGKAKQQNFEPSRVLITEAKGMAVGVTDGSALIQLFEQYVRYFRNDDPESVKMLIEYLDERQWRNSNTAIQSLGQKGSAATRALPKLKHLLKEGDITDRSRRIIELAIKRIENGY